MFKVLLTDDQNWKFECLCGEKFWTSPYGLNTSSCPKCDSAYVVCPKCGARQNCKCKSEKEKDAEFYKNLQNHWSK